jgi:hypothetical protein
MAFAHQHGSGSQGGSKNAIMIPSGGRLKRPVCREKPQGPVDADRDVALAGADVVGATVAVERELDHRLLVADREEPCSSQEVLPQRGHGLRPLARGGWIGFNSAMVVPSSGPQKCQFAGEKSTGSGIRALCGPEWTRLPNPKGKTGPKVDPAERIDVYFIAATEPYTPKYGKVSKRDAEIIKRHMAAVAAR